MLSRLLSLVYKEFVVLLRDPRSRFFVIAPPIIQLIVFSNAATFDLIEAPLAIFDESRTELSRALAASFDASEAFEIVAWIHDDQQVRQLLDSKTCLAVVRIPQRFAADLARHQPTPVQVLLDARNSNTALLALSYTQQIVDRFNRQLAGRDIRRSTGPRIEVVSRAWFNPNLLSRWFFVPGIVALVTLVTSLIVTALSVAREREQLTLERVLVTPYQPIELLIGKTIPGVLIGLTSASIVIFVALIVFRIPLRGSLPALYLGLTTFLLSCVGIGLFVSSLARSQQQGLMGAFIFFVPAVILSGFATPVHNMPAFFQYVAYIDPLYYCLRVVRAVFLQGATVGDVAAELAAMTALGLGALSLAALFFRRATG